MQKVEIPIQPEDEARFFYYAKLYGMKATRKGRNSPYFTVEFEDPLNLYWLGANMVGDPTGGRPALQHGPIESRAPLYECDSPF